MTAVFPQSWMAFLLPTALWVDFSDCGLPASADAPADAGDDNAARFQSRVRQLAGELRMFGTLARDVLPLPPSPWVMLSYSWGAMLDPLPGTSEPRFQWQVVVRKLCLELRRVGFRVWMDVDFMTGDTHSRMAEAVNGASHVVILYSQRYQWSGACQLEANFTVASDSAAVVPVALEDMQPKAWLAAAVGDDTSKHVSMVGADTDDAVFAAAFQDVVARLTSAPRDDVTAVDDVDDVATQDAEKE